MINLIKLAGIIMIFSAASMTGAYLSASLHQRCIRLETLRRMTEDIASYIRYRELTVYEIVQELSTDSFYRDFDFVCCLSRNLDRHRPFYGQWESAADECRFKGDERNLILSLGNVLGTSDTQGQLAAIELYSAKLDSMIKASDEQYSRKGKLYRSLGVLSGAMLGILML